MYQLRSKAFQHGQRGLGFVAPGPRAAFTRMAPPPESDVTATAPGSVYMSYGPGLRDEDSALWNAIPARSIEETGPQATYDIQGQPGLGAAARVLVQGSAAGSSTGPPRVEVEIPEARPAFPPWLLLAVAGALAFGYVRGGFDFEGF